MHIKPGTWEASSTVCEPDALYDPAALVSPPDPEPPVRNRRLSPGAGEGGGGGGGGNRLRGKPETATPPPAPSSELRAQLKGRGPRKHPEGPRGGRARRGERERWVGEGLSLLKPPPAFPVQDSPAKLQPAVSYASKVKSGGGAGGGAEDAPAIGVLLQNQWGLSFISEGPPPASPAHPAEEAPAPETRAESPPPATPPAPVGREEADPSGELLLGCRHLVEALRYHTQEWAALHSKQKQGSAKVVWYKNTPEQPA